ncbi:alpha/beta fold hydrolase [Pseudonocardia nantongensis]|uniref:alpha/beta fold hydrolase n=1 Tax=Pseudonocardia nantongensis TaxID=1181885 RepID=UPI00397AE7EB
MRRRSGYRALVVVLALLVAGCGARPAAPPDGCGAEVPGLERRTAELPGVRLHHAVGGRGPVIVLVHGFPETWRVWAPVGFRLLDRFTVVLPDLRGIGCSSVPTGGYDTRTRAADLGALLDRIAPGRRVVAVGHDLGGMVAYAWARDRRDQVRGLVVTGAGVPGAGLAELAPPHVARFAADPDGVADEARGREREWLAAFTASQAFATSGALDDAVAAYDRPGRLRTALAQYAALPRDAAVQRAERSDPLTIPVTALEGGAPGTASATLPWVAARVRTVVVPGTGHYLQVERPEAVAAAIAGAAGG